MPSFHFTDTAFLLLLSPASAVFATEYILSWTGPLAGRILLTTGLGINLLVHMAIRQWLCLRSLYYADQHLGRMWNPARQITSSPSPFVSPSFRSSFA